MVKHPICTVLHPPSAMEAKAPSSTFMVCTEFLILVAIKIWAMFTESMLVIAFAQDLVFSKIKSVPTEPSTSNATKLHYKRLENITYQKNYSRDNRPSIQSLGRLLWRIRKNFSLLSCLLSTIQLIVAQSMGKTWLLREQDFLWTKTM